jgi:UPF0716 family protein affecting phage T7 exclusion
MTDFLASLLEIGLGRGGWRSIWAVAGAVLGLVLGVWLAWNTGGLATAGWGAAGAAVGWGLFVALAGFARFVPVFLACLVLVLGWYWLTGKL